MLQLKHPKSECVPDQWSDWHLNRVARAVDPQLTEAWGCSPGLPLLPVKHIYQNKNLKTAGGEVCPLALSADHRDKKSQAEIEPETTASSEYF